MKIRGVSVFTGKAIELTIAGDRISNVEDVANPRDGLPCVAPGFLDMQVNGYHGSDYSLKDFASHHIISIIESLARSGTTQHVPTFVSMPQDRLLRNLSITAKAIDDSPRVAAAIPGLHIEGPYISSEDGPRGAHDRNFVRDPAFEEFQAWQEAARGKISFITLAPERKGAIDFIRRVTAMGVKVSIGHTGAGPEDIRQAVEAGASLSTHLGNGSYTMLPRLKNYVWEQLAEDRLMAGCIADGFHLPGAVVRSFARAKGMDRLILVSDVALLGGYPPGLYKWGDLDVEVFPDDHLGLPGSTILAGAAHLLDWDIPRFLEFTGQSLATTIPLCTSNPARFLGIREPRYGQLSVGAPAHLCLFHYAPGDRRLNIEQTFRSGEQVYARAEK